MDSEEQLEIQKARREGRPETDEGPFYHEAWWESYKGSVKGKLGGAAAGTIASIPMGVIAAGILSVTVGLGAAPVSTGLMIVAGFAAAGMLYGAHEFSDVGKIVGSNAAVAEKQEQRTNARFAKIEKKLDDLKAMISGKKQAAGMLAKAPEKEVASADAASHAPEQYRTQHCDEHCPPDKPKWVFWNVAAVGLIAGLAAGALLAGGGLVEEAAHALGAAGKPLLHGAGKAAQYAISMTTMGLFGASFGINRDMFRQVFDKTDLWFRGIVKNGKKRERQIAQAQEKVQSADKPIEKASLNPSAPIITVVLTDEPTSTFHRERLDDMRALLQMDHSKAIRQ